MFALKLLLFGCALTFAYCSDDNGDNDLKKACETTVNWLEECFSNDMGVIMSVEDCVLEYSDSEEASKNCRETFIDFADCIDRLDCDEITDKCAEEEAYNRECEGV